MAKQAEVTPIQALESAALLFEFEAEDAKAKKNYSWRNEALACAKTLRQLKQTLESESEITMIYDAQKGTIRGTQAELKQLVELVIAEVRSKIQADVKQVMAAERTKVFKQKPNPFFGDNQQVSLQDYVNGKGKH